MAETTTAAETVSIEWVEEFADRWIAAWNSHQPERVLELMTDDIVYDDSGWPQTLRGHAQVREFLEFMWRAFPDLAVERVGDPLVASDGSRAAFWWRARMTNRGPIDPPGIPATGKRSEYEGADFHDYRDGKVARLRIVFDMADILRQLGLLPERGSAAARVMVGMQKLRARLSEPEIVASLLTSCRRALGVPEQPVPHPSNPQNSRSNDP
jgi:steroid delta-isomerase-like uncharacterized protein